MDGRDKNGRFAKGHKPYNKGGRKKKVPVPVPFDELKKHAPSIWGQLVEKAKGGDLGAIRLYLAYVYGEPVQRSESLVEGYFDVKREIAELGTKADREAD